ncbi:uncharacterized protein LOC105253346 [Camponotus floridanus]|uniref:uncharacterized protein LOC105253346 n=1 Tax=Camponotus floridanus TaxID=104421 RepID=UPI000DC66E49|nr:uncharacterized protein LOC105253346 [Camponotus floridanus]
MLFIVSLILLLLLMGFLKWFMGLYIPGMGRWGLDSLLETSTMSRYLERDLRYYNRVVRDEHGAPVHPETRRRTVRICSRKMEFLLNAMFFLIFPFAVCCYRLKRFFRLDRRRCCSSESKISLASDKSEHTKTICVNTYGDSRDSQMEAEDIEYVMNELNKSEESLRNHSRNKRNRCIKEYRSCH